MPTPLPIPSPWRSLLRTLIYAVIAFILLAIFWAIWYAHAAHVLKTRLIEYHNRGEPTNPADLFPPLPAGTDNAYDHLATALTAMSSLSADEQNLIGRFHPNHFPGSPATMAQAKAMIERHPDIPAALEKARNAPITACPFPPHSTMLFSDSFKLARFLRLTACYHHHNHRDDLAFIALQNLATVAKISAHLPYTYSHLTYTTIYTDHALDAWMHIAPNLKTTPPHGTPREQLLTHIHELLDDSFPHENLLRTFRTERAAYLAYLDSRKLGILATPIIRLDFMNFLNYHDTAIQACNSISDPYPIVAARFPKRPEYSTSNLRNCAQPFSNVVYSEHRIIEHHHHALTARRAIALRLAIRLYQLDHNNQIPPDLQSLIPTYLPQLPIDTFRPDRGPLTYIPARRLFYSYGVNSLDDAGTPSTTHDPLDGPDLVFPLDR
ncbi:MAG: hypothetical protein FWD53_04535 [Phycisphaerales bacterium]|nr:hypothetical protein [Phycisphaerales bacterium]